MLWPRSSPMLLAALCTCALGAGCSATVDDTPPGVDPTPDDGIDPPFAVSTFFAPSGYMGDGATGSAVAAETAATACAPRPPGARGDCYKFTYAAGTQLWAGVYWQFPANNWGGAEGKKIAPGATTVAFWAAGGAGGEVLNVTAGGVHDVTLPHSDTLKAQTKVTLTTEMTRYTIDLAGQRYDQVIGAFAWSAGYPPATDPKTARPIVIYLDDIVWE